MTNIAKSLKQAAVNFRMEHMKFVVTPARMEALRQQEGWNDTVAGIDGIEIVVDDTVRYESALVVDGRVNVIEERTSVPTIMYSQTESFIDSHPDWEANLREFDQFLAGFKGKAGFTLGMFTDRIDSKTKWTVAEKIVKMYVDAGVLRHVIEPECPIHYRAMDMNIYGRPYCMDCDSFHEDEKLYMRDVYHIVKE